MVQLSILSKYPFLSESKKYVKNNDISVGELFENPLYERARVIGIERLDNAFSNKDVGNRSCASETDNLMELLSYPIARILAVCIGDTYFKRRYALGEAIHAYKNLINEPTSFLLELAEEFNLDVKKDEETDKINIHFTDYLHNAPTRYMEWKMINREMKKGYIKITHKDLARIIQETLRNRINEELDNRQCDENLMKFFSTDIQRIQNTVMIHRKKIEAEPIGKLDTKKLPPCMKEILAAIQNGENVPHIGRFALVSFFNSLKLNKNEIMNIFSTAPDFEEERTRYQIDHITGDNSATKYRPPGCSKMRTYGICPVDKMDELCKKTRHPFSYYRNRWRQENKK